MSNSVINVSLPNVDKLLSDLLKPFVAAAGQSSQEGAEEKYAIALSEYQIYTLVDALDEVIDARTGDAINLLNQDALDEEAQAQTLNLMDEAQGLTDLKNHLLYQMLG